MKRSRFNFFVMVMLFSVICFTLLTGCAGQRLSSDFDEAEVKSAAEKVVALINAQDSKGLLELCTVQTKYALTEDVLAKIYEAIGEGGKFVKVEEISVGGATDKSSEQEYAVVVLKANYEIRNFIYTISFTKQMKLAGLYYK
jgi:hypothetical protein